MTPVVHEFENLTFFVGSEDPEKRRHVHVETPDGETRIWLDPIEHDPKQRKGNFTDKDLKKAME